MNKQLQEVWAVLMADRRKAGALGSLMLVAGGLWIRAALMSGPSKVHASGGATGADGDNGGASGLSSAQSPGSAPVLPSRAITFSAPPPLSRDLFALSDAILASSPQTDSAPTASPKFERGKDETRVTEPVVSPKTTEELVRDQVERLRLRSTMISSNSIAVIETMTGSRQEARVLRIGDEINGFTLIAVMALQVELEKDGVRVTITRQPQ